MPMSGKVRDVVRTVHFGGSARPVRLGGAPSTSAPAGRAGGGDEASIKAADYLTPPVARAGRSAVGRKKYRGQRFGRSWSAAMASVSKETHPQMENMMESQHRAVLFLHGVIEPILLRPVRLATCANCRRLVAAVLVESTTLDSGAARPGGDLAGQWGCWPGRDLQRAGSRRHLDRR